MKYYAHILADSTSEKISVVTAQQMRKKDPAAWDKRTYYSLWHLTPMSLRVRQNGTAYFAFLPNSNPHPSETAGGEGYVHVLSKEVIREKGEITCIYGKDETRIKDTIRFDGEAQVEFRLDDGQYIADLKVVVANKNAFGIDIGSTLIIEICNTHKVDLTKRKYFREKNIPAIEVTLPSNLSEEMDYDKLRYRLNRLFEGCYFNWLHNPNWKQRYLPQKQSK